MPLTLSDQDLNELQALMGDFRHKEAMTVISFINERHMRQQKEVVAAAKKQEVAVAHDKLVDKAVAPIADNAAATPAKLNGKGKKAGKVVSLPGLPSKPAQPEASPA